MNLGARFARLRFVLEISQPIGNPWRVSMTRMPAYADVLPYEQVVAVLSFIKSR